MGAPQSDHVIKFEPIKEQYGDLEKKNNELSFKSIEEILEYINSPTGVVEQVKIGLENTLKNGYNLKKDITF